NRMKRKKDKTSQTLLSICNPTRTWLHLVCHTLKFPPQTVLRVLQNTCTNIHIIIPKTPIFQKIEKLLLFINSAWTIRFLGKPLFNMQLMLCKYGGSEKRGLYNVFCDARTSVKKSY
ncbi:hypothetical protein ACTXT7_016030, partial [Hymenolepis weldensis]